MDSDEQKIKDALKGVIRAIAGMSALDPADMISFHSRTRLCSQVAYRTRRKRRRI